MWPQIGHDCFPFALNQWSMHCSWKLCRHTDKVFTSEVKLSVQMMQVCWSPFWWVLFVSTRMRMRTTISRWSFAQKKTDRRQISERHSKVDRCRRVVRSFLAQCSWTNGSTWKYCANIRFVFDLSRWCHQSIEPNRWNNKRHSPSRNKSSSDDDLDDRPLLGRVATLVCDKLTFRSVRGFDQDWKSDEPEQMFFCCTNRMEFSRAQLGQVCWSGRACERHRRHVLCLTQELWFGLDCFRRQQEQGSSSAIINYLKAKGETNARTTFTFIIRDWIFNRNRNISCRWTNLGAK